MYRDFAILSYRRRLALDELWMRHLIDGFRVDTAIFGLLQGNSHAKPFLCHYKTYQKA